jgi:hypothetical protein
LNPRIRIMMVEDMMLVLIGWLKLVVIVMETLTPLMRVARNIIDSRTNIMNVWLTIASSWRAAEGVAG